jgi:hypothetical protein
MRKVALVRILKTYSDDLDRSAVIAEAVGEWYEVDETQYKALLRFVNRSRPYGNTHYNVTLIEQLDRAQFDLSIEKALEYEKEEEERLRKAQAVREKAKQTALENKRKKDLELLKELKAKYDDEL